MKILYSKSYVFNLIISLVINYKKEKQNTNTRNIEKDQAYAVFFQMLTIFVSISLEMSLFVLNFGASD